MQIEGTLTKWNDDRGFGFIAPTQGGQEIFVHISVFPKDGQRPRLGEPLSFEIETDKDGKKRARAVSRPVRAKAARATQSKYERSRKNRSLVGRVAPLVVLVALGVYGYSEYSRISSTPVTMKDIESTHASSSNSQDSSTHFRCDGRIHCSQMKSCTEAKFFLKNCPGVKMDGDHDGVPCEEQHCNSLFAK